MSSEHESIQPSQPNRIFAALRDVCAALYPEERNTRLIVADAGLDERQVAFSSRAQTNWHNILAEAIRGNRLDALLDVVRTAYPTNQPLQVAITSYHQFIAAGGHLDAPAQLPAGVDPYDVHGLANPYLGLRAFRYEDRVIYAGRDAKIREALEKLTEPGKEQAVLFVTGASGSGKSSFVQAGLLPRLQEHYQKRHKQVRIAIFRPRDQPLANLDDALSQLAPNASRDLAAFTPVEQINVLIIDQFEEVFTQAHLPVDAEFFQWLQEAPAFQPGRTHIIATVRSDYLNELFNLTKLYDLNRYGLNLRTMTVDELSETIQRPLQECFPNGERRFEPALVQKLAQDASLRPTLLPLLQVTLQKLWKQGSLKLAAYTNLTDAIQERAEEVYLFSDHINVDPQAPRPARDQQELMGILLDLIHVAVDDTDRRDVRQPRTRRELEQSSAHRPRLIEELVNARLLSAASETRNGEDVEVIDIIHESLIDNWGRLRNAIEEQRQQLQRRARFKLWLGEWLRNGRQDGYLLLTDMQLAEARALVEERDIEVQGEEARGFYRRSLEYHEAEQRAKDEAEAAHKARQQWLQRVGVALIIMVIAAGIALWQWQRAEIAAIGEAQARETSDASAKIANEARSKSEHAQATAVSDALARATAEVQAQQQAKVAQLAQATAIAAKAETELLKDQIRADQLAQTALVVDREEGRSQLSLLLAIESARIITPPLSSSLTSIYELLSKIGGEERNGHEGVINAVAFSPDGKLVASSSHDHTIRVWRVDNSTTAPVILYGGGGGVYSVTFSPDGKLLVGVSSGNISVWQVADLSASPISLVGDTQVVYALAFSPDAKLFASGGLDTKIRIWHVDNLNSPPLILNGHTRTINWVKFSTDSKLLFSASEDTTIRRWHVDGSNSIGLQQNVGYSTLSPDGKLLASVANNNLYLWRINNPEAILTVRWGKVIPINSIMFSPDSKLLAMTSNDKTIRLWRTDKLNTEPAVLRSDKDISGAMLFSPDSKLLATGGNDATLQLWHLENFNAAPIILRGHTHSITTLAFSPNGELLASAGDDTSVRLWRMKSLITEPIILRDHTRSVNTVAFSPDGKWLASAGDDTSIRLWKMNNPLVDPIILDGHTDRIFALSFNPNSKLLVSTAYDQSVRLWQVNNPTANPTVLYTISDKAAAVFSPNGKLLASASVIEGKIQLWQVDDLEVDPIELQPEDAVRISPYNFIALAFNSDGTLLASTDSERTIRLWQIDDSDTELKVLEFESIVTDVVFSPDGKLFASIMYPHAINVWRVDDFNTISIVLHVTEGALTDVTFSPDSKLLAGTDRSNIYLWHTNNLSGTPIVIRGNDSWPNGVAFSPDGRWLASANFDTTVRLWTARTEELLMLSCHMAGRNFTLDEWQQYLGVVQPYSHTCPQWPIPSEVTPTPVAP